MKCFNGYLKKIGLTLLVIGLVSLFIQSTWYGYIDAEGVIHDSVFLPIGVFSLVGATVALMAECLYFLLGKCRNKK